MGRDLLKLLLRVGGEDADPGLMRKGDVGRFLHGVAERDMLGRGPLAQAQFDLGARGGIEMRPDGDEALDDLAGRVRLDRIMDIRRAQPLLELVILIFHSVDVENERRLVDHQVGKGSIQTGNGRKGAQSDGCNVGHVNLRQTGAQCPKVPKETLPSLHKRVPIRSQANRIRSAGRGQRRVRWRLEG